MLEVHSTKKFVNLPCGHAQYFDKNPDGTPGNCASVHGYDRSVEFTFSGSVDEHGWVVPFGDLKPLKAWLEYYFDHVTILGADDPRVPDMETDRNMGGILKELRLLPYGVSMEMSSLFIWYHVNAWVLNKTFGRVYISRVESAEHERNSAFVTVSREVALNQADLYPQENLRFLPMKKYWDFVAPREAIRKINSVTRSTLD